MDEPETIQLRVLGDNRPVFERLLRKLDMSLPDIPSRDQWNNVIQRFGGGLPLSLSESESKPYRIRNASAHEACINAWAYALRSTDLTLEQLYYGKVSIPKEIADIRQNHPGFDPAALVMLGVPIDHIAGWESTPIRRAPHYIHTAVVKERPKGHVPITASQYMDLLQDVGSEVILDKSGGSHGFEVLRVKARYIRQWYELVAGLREVNVDPDELFHLAGWVTSGWSAQAMIRFEDNGINPIGAAKMEELGVTRSDLIVAVVRGEMPVDWAIAASELDQ